MALFPSTDTRPLGEVETPYQSAHQVWDERLGSARAQVTRWQLAAGAFFLLTLLAIYGLIVQSQKALVTAYIVEVDTTGTPRVVQYARERFQPTRAMMQHQAREFLTAIRSLPTDAMVARKQWLWAYGQVTERGKRLLGEKVREYTLLDELGKKIVQVEMQRVIPVSDTSFDVTWREVTYDPKGQLVLSEVYSGLVTLMLRPPTTDADILSNPLGVWVDGFSWSKKE